jgi:crotonobetainyl-CoA:carnitine CoA-transferase CaiB-like acyl-CoA transferase
MRDGFDCTEVLDRVRPSRNADTGRLFTQIRDTRVLKRDQIEADLPPHVPRPPGADTALGPIRVVDFTHFVAGPMATMWLADLGADVIKIEAPGKGDEFRYYPPADPTLKAQGAPFLWCNRNKRSLSIDLKHSDGISAVRELIAGADIVIENFSTGVMKRLGLDYETCRQLNHRLIYCSVSAYGRNGEFSDRLGFDPIAQAESGFVSMNGYPDREGVRAGSPVMDIGTALMATNALLAALVARARTGKGQFIEVAMLSAAITMVGFAAMQNLFSGFEYQRFGNTSPDTAPSGVFKAQDDKSFYINSGNTKIFQRLFRDVLDRPEIADDPLMIDRESRVRNRARLFSLLEELFATQPWDYWRRRLRAASIPAGEVRTVGAALKSAEVNALGLVSRIPHPIAGWIPNIAPPFCFSDTPVVDPTPAPALGQHTVAILRDVLGYDEARIQALLQNGALGPALTPKPAIPTEINAADPTGSGTDIMFMMP